MKTLFAATIAAVVIAAGASTAAQARDGCGRGYHRGPAGHCRPNIRPGYVAGPVIVRRPVVGVYYPGRGYWYKDRYWKHRYRHHRGWRYR